MANTYLNKTLGSGNRDKWTWSAWVKKHSNGSILPLFHADDGSSNYYTHISFHDTDQLFFQNRYANTNKGYKISTQVFRDNNAWYHVQFVWDSNNSTADDRQIIYVNGERITAYDVNITPNLDQNTTINDGYEHRIGRGGTGFNGSAYANVTLSHVHFADGQALAPTVFGSTDNVTGQWKINTSPSFTLGTNGFTILKDGNTITDQSANSNNWTLGGGTLTNTEDCPSNVFATLNPLTRINTSQSPSKIFNNANTTFEVGSNVWGEAMSTLAVSSGKYYVEFNIEKLESSNGYAQVGVMDYDLWGTTNNTYQYFLSNTASAGLRLDYRTGQSSLDTGGSSVTSNVGDFVNGDKIGLAVDMDNKAMYVHKNGVYYQVGGVTGVPTSGSSKTGALTIPSACTIVGIGCATYSTSARISVNYGNGYFRTTVISSEGTNASGIGKFEYDVPAGYTALSTKGLNL